MSNYRPQFAFYTVSRNRWRWTLYADGMEPIATSAVTARTLDDCIAHAHRVTGIATSADLWHAPDQTWLPHPQARAA